MSTSRPDTWMPFYIGAYLADTMHLSRDEHGGYMLLLMAYWRNGGPLPDDDEYLRQVCKATQKEWAKLKAVLSRFFTVSGGRWSQKRADLELAEANANVERQSARTRAATEARKVREGQRNDQRNDSRNDDRERPPKTDVTSSPLPSPSPVEKSSDPNGSGGAGPPETLGGAVWKQGKALLAEHGGLDTRKAGGLLGKWVKDHGPGVVVAALLDFEKAPRAEMVSWMEARLRGESGLSDEAARKAIEAGLQ